MARFGISIRTMIVATFFVSLLGLNAAMAQSNGDINSKNHSANIQTIQYGTPEQSVVSSGSEEKTSKETQASSLVVTTHKHVVVQAGVNANSTTHTEQCTLCPKDTMPAATGCGCTVPPIGQACQPCGYNPSSSGTKPSPMMCDTMCAY